MMSWLSIYWKYIKLNAKMKCELCHKKIWFWQNWISPEELVYYHDSCFKRARKNEMS